jgi:hypothetical protein
MKDLNSKWMWKMAWCKTKGYAPANETFWDMAEEAYILNEHS